MRAVLHWLLLAIAVVGIALTGVLALAWLFIAPHTLDLTPGKAAETISARPEFNQSKVLITVSSTTRGADSLKDTSYTAEFIFRPRSSPTPVEAHGEFQYWNGGWHLREFSWGEPPNKEWVAIQSDVPPD